MEVIKFTISGKTAHFKNPQYNSFSEFSYNHLHKPALLGIIGSIIGLSGYQKEALNNFDKPKKEKVYKMPEWYEMLNDIKVAIVPKKVVFNKMKQGFNNSTNFANDRSGLQIKEMWLEDVSWDVYVINDRKCVEDLKNNLLSKKVVYYPYLGKNDHMATISNVKVYEEVSDKSSVTAEEIKGLFIMEDTEGKIVPKEKWASRKYYLYEEELPVDYQAETFLYELKYFKMTSGLISNNGFEFGNIYQIEGSNYYFF